MTLARIALETLAAYPVRVVLTLSPRHPREELGVVPINARLSSSCPIRQYSKRKQLLISHAGHGIVAKALYYGVPMVLVPWDPGSAGVAARAAALGVRK
jgi:UDP:flavonoid glycosyltransferase YjiC (YdhE family)